MTGLQMAMAIILILISLALIIVVLVQKDRQSNANAVTGGSDTSSSFFDKTKGHQKDAALGNATKVLGVLLVIVAIATLAITLFL